MRILILSLMTTLVACGESTRPESGLRPTAAKASSSQQTPATQEVTQQETTSTNNQIEPSDTPGTVNPAPSSPVAMDTAALEPQVEAIFAQNPKLDPQQAQDMSATTMDLIKASNAGDQGAVSGLSSKLLNQALLGGQGFGLVDAGGLATAIQDLVNAAIDADVAGILDAVDDIVSAVTA